MFKRPSRRLKMDSVSGLQVCSPGMCKLHHFDRSSFGRHTSFADRFCQAHILYGNTPRSSFSIRFTVAAMQFTYYRKRREDYRGPLEICLLTWMVCPIVLRIIFVPMNGVDTFETLPPLSTSPLKTVLHFWR